MQRRTESENRNENLELNRWMYRNTLSMNIFDAWKLFQRNDDDDAGDDDDDIDIMIVVCRKSDFTCASKNYQINLSFSEIGMSYFHNNRFAIAVFFFFSRPRILFVCSYDEIKCTRISGKVRYGRPLSVHRYLILYVSALTVAFAFKAYDAQYRFKRKRNGDRVAFDSISVSKIKAPPWLFIFSWFSSWTPHFQASKLKFFVHTTFSLTTCTKGCATFDIRWRFWSFVAGTFHWGVEFQLKQIWNTSNREKKKHNENRHHI